MAQESRTAYEGLANLANSVRRSTALYVAMSIVPEDSSVEDLLAAADRLAQWLVGTAAEQTAARDRGQTLGLTLDEVTGGS